MDNRKGNFKTNQGQNNYCQLQLLCFPNGLWCKWFEELYWCCGRKLYAYHLMTIGNECLLHWRKIHGYIFMLALMLNVKLVVINFCGEIDLWFFTFLAKQIHNWLEK